MAKVFEIVPGISYKTDQSVTWHLSRRGVWCCVSKVFPVSTRFEPVTSLEGGGSRLTKLRRKVCVGQGFFIEPFLCAGP